ncbi:MAG: CTP synthetase [Candidatus Falkowbacteria bacterium GW2011_GWC2_38_22]|uniref:CTP synthase n=1 Tax=Candidatus Falkowbacteria bacterium GW2011_GWE1_38_31 TaxID=1618638 RepID=A0A0G0JV76_9BACT|nr:MAG: CTP synthetase [Candidatus Falkowbacteria bacterium GW2011_GWF2_38_1205]KKQ61726.1 MAG: CTP synthetase [Candidatus Falkowbacteria bacterium GW2011_GWC2_38_22]KKQ63659.1 MAG: CTP synthetase [Candidatus Falkowbacteria bacterium GW2011_GWF1_38_22]KKQ65925.1 MAG: CTP synthetase [Candidatus Falkowbacteria bacterium GW2011_GWE2_38_254]KKQ70522.1 MAG: CTP synthetase [Candidatus Falkowbacteria bacterium GW2011_GWE1_38_31]KKQ72918.1 MAG: CTP synthetase [Candidatus Falkowbacteria bacterium GW201
MATKKEVKKVKNKKKNTKYIFVVGGVMSGVGKGITTASIGRILQSKGYNVSAIKVDPYINVDAGTMNPIEHGEVFVTEDGDETDQDVGNYERFLNKNIYRENYMTTGRVYKSVIERERNLEYEGKCVEVVPHIPMEIRDRIHKAVKKSQAEIMIIEIGGTVGEYQNMLFLEAARMMKLYEPKNVLFVMVSYLPIPEKVGEMKTKPTQYAIRTLNSAGIQPDFIVGRSRVAMDAARRKKIAINCNISPDDVISAPDIDSIYDVPLNFEKDKLGNRILSKFGLKSNKNDMADWKKMVDTVKNSKTEVNIGIVGKYFTTGDFCLSDSYISVIEAIKHAGVANKCKPVLHWINTDDIEKNGTAQLAKYDGIIVPQGWGSRGSEGKIKTIQYCREKKKPYFGLCYGMQMAVIEFARNVCKLTGANSEEVDAKTPHPVIHIMPGQKELLAKKQYGGTIRLGGWPCKIKSGTHFAKAYAKKFGTEKIISERHRHRYEFNNAYREQFEKKGLMVVGTSPDDKIVEAIEIKDHPFFIGTQFHPEYISRPLDPHPLFVEFVKVCLKR